MKNLIWGYQIWYGYPVTCVNFDSLKPILNGLLSQKTHTTCIPSRHISKQCVFGPTVAPFNTPLCLMNPFTCWAQNVHTFLQKKYFSSSPCEYIEQWAINYILFNVIFILRHPGMIFTNSYLDILNLRTHLISSKSVSPTLKLNSTCWCYCMHKLIEKFIDVVEFNGY